MSKSKKNGFLSLDHDFVRSDTVASLSARGKALMLAMADRYNGRNNGSIPYSVKEAMAWLHCSPNTAIKTLREVEAAGLIVPGQKGSFDNKTGARKGTATKWQLTFLR